MENNFIMNVRKGEIEKFIKKRLHKNCKVSYLNKKNKCIIGKIRINQEDLFLKITSFKEGSEEIRGYNLVKDEYPVPFLRNTLRLRSNIILIYDYEGSVEKDDGLILDLINKEKISLNLLNKISDIYKKSFARTKRFRKNYPLSKYFGKRVKQMKKGLLDNPHIINLLDYKFIINRKIYSRSLRELLDDVSYYFEKNYRELCFLTQGDPLTINIGTRPIFFDFETSGINPVVAEFAIFFWGVFIAESYYYPKYNKKSYLIRKKYIKKVSQNKPKIRFRIDNNRKIISINIKYSPTRSQREIISFYIENLMKPICKESFQSVVNKVRYFLAMRIMASFDSRILNKEDLVSSLAFLNIFCNPLKSKVLNIEYNLMFSI